MMLFGRFAFNEDELELAAAARLVDPDPFRGTTIVKKGGNAVIACSFPLNSQAIAGKGTPDDGTAATFEAAFNGPRLANLEIYLRKIVSSDIAKNGPKSSSLKVEWNFVGGDLPTSDKAHLDAAQTSQREAARGMVEVVWTASIPQPLLRALAGDRQDAIVSIDDGETLQIGNNALVLRRFLKRITWYQGRAEGRREAEIAREAAKEFGAGPIPPRD
jgi:hypothetical protein